jgi:hypothetical protein
VTRESIYAALFALGASVENFATSSRRLQHIDDLQPANFPAFYQTQNEEEWSQVRENLPPIGNLRVEWWVYVQNGDTTAALSSQLNVLVDALINSLQLPPSTYGGQSLDGLATGVALDAPIQYAEGGLADRAFARIQLVIKTAG